MRTGHADLPLHSGRAPRWLFERMTALSREMALAILAEEGASGLLRRLADPVWFQTFGCVLGFDWHSSGLTTTVCGALKEGLRPVSGTGLEIAGGKGRASRRTPEEIERACWRTGQEPALLVRASRLSAKVDSAAVQDGFDVYHHCFLFTPAGEWAVIQQGMNDRTGMARRYHWLTPPRFDRDPHSAVAGAADGTVLNLVAAEAEGNRLVSTELAREEPSVVVREVERMRTISMPRRHQVLLSDVHPDRLGRLLLHAYEAQPGDFSQLLAVAGVGARSLRALSLVAELAYGEPASVRDPVSYSFAHGGKDGTPFPVDRRTYDATIDSLHRALLEARVGRNEKVAALRRLAQLPDPAATSAEGLHLPGATLA
ncbi:MAG: DUF763 domain-containing protein [Candidatus Dormibacteraeota bacterium]|nr:DUF763 domain-containing protein [Candidatus Dormibacteraeota bacterium]